MAADLLCDFEHGVFFVGLAPIRDPLLIPSVVAQTLGVREVAGTSLLESLKAYLKEKQLLLFLDNFEQVLAAAPMVAELLAAAPRLQILVTSRAVLHLRGEKEFLVPPLSLPDLKHLPSLEVLSQYAAVELFIQRALDVSPEFAVTHENAPAVAEICAWLDGLPLAIELAAARIKLLPPQALLGRLDSRLKLLTGGARDLPARQQTLRGAVSWSHDLLDEAERTLFRRLAVFAGGCTLEAAEAVACRAAVGACDAEAGIDVLEGVRSLVDKSLLRQEERTDGEPRLSMLETVREFGLECLAESGEADTIRRRHVAFFLALAEEAEPELWRDVAWVERLEHEHDNLRVAIDWCLKAVDSGQGLVVSSDNGRSVLGPDSAGLSTDRYPLSTAAEMGLRLAGALHWFWHIRGHFTEGRRRLELALAGCPSGEVPVRRKALCAAAQIAGSLGDHEQARAWGEESLALCQEAGDRVGVAWSLLAMAGGLLKVGSSARRPGAEQALSQFREIGDKPGAALALYMCGMAATDEQRGIALHEESLALCRSMGYRWLSSYPLEALGWDALTCGPAERARALFEESLVIRREYGDRAAILHTLHGLWYVAHDTGDTALAKAVVEESLVLSRESGNKPIAVEVLEGAGLYSFLRGDYERARVHLEESLGLSRELGRSAKIGVALLNLARAAQAQGDHRRAATLREEARALCEERLAAHRERGEKESIAQSLNVLGSIALDQGDHGAARALCEESLAMFRQLGVRPENKRRFANLLTNLGIVTRAAGEYEAARVLLEESLATHRETGQRPSIVKDLEGLAAVAVAQGQPTRAARLFGTAESLREVFLYPLPPAERAEHNRCVAAVRRALGAAEFAPAWVEGRAMSLDEAIEFALVSAAHA